MLTAVGVFVLTPRSWLLNPTRFFQARIELLWKKNFRENAQRLDHARARTIIRQDSVFRIPHSGIRPGFNTEY